MTDLQTLLERAVDHAPDVDVAADLRRGHRAVARRRRAILGGSAALVLGVGAAAAAYPSVHEHQAAASHRADGVPAGAFVLPSVPDGWEVQAADDSRVLISPAGLPKQSFEDPQSNIRVLGRLFLHLRSLAPPKDSRTLSYDGRTFYDVESGPYPARGYPQGAPPRQLVVRVQSGGWLWLQEAPRLGWTLTQMAEFLDGITVEPGATVEGD